MIALKNGNGLTSTSFLCLLKSNFKKFHFKILFARM